MTPRTPRRSAAARGGADAPRDLDDLVAKRRLRATPGASASVVGFLDRAEQLLRSAAALEAVDPATACVVAYDAAKHAGLAILAARELRCTPQGGHLAIEEALMIVDAKRFAAYRGLRRRRNELDYPTGPDDLAAPGETEEFIADAEGIVDAARDLLGFPG